MFILERWIIDNTLIAQEITLTISKKTRDKGGLMIIKFDMRKADGMIEWNFYNEYPKLYEFLK